MRACAPCAATLSLLFAPSGPGCGLGVEAMTVTRIIVALEESPAAGAQACAAGRLGFLEWVFDTPGPVTAQMAREALAEPAAQAPKSAAARAFVGFLEEACASIGARPARRRRGQLVH